MSSSSPPTAETCPICNGDPRYAVAGYCLHLDVTVGGTTTRAISKSKEEENAEWDRRMATAASSVPRVNPKKSAGAPAAGTPPETTAGADTSASPTNTTPETSDARASTAPASSTRSRRRRPKATKRTSEQTQRAADQEKRNAEYRDWWTSLGTATEGQLEDERAFLASIKKAESL